MIETTPKEQPTVSGREGVQEKTPDPAAVATSLPPRCSSAIAFRTDEEKADSPAQSRPASSPSALGTTNPALPPRAATAALPDLQRRLPPTPSATCRTPSPVSTTVPFYAQGHGGYRSRPSSPITRDEACPIGPEVPYLGGSQISPYSTFPSPEYGYSPSGQPHVYQQPGLPTPGLGLLGMSRPPPLASYGTPPRMGGHKKRQNSAAAKSWKTASPTSTRQYSPRESNFARPTQQSPARAFQPAPLPPEVDGSLLEPREWPIIKIENVSVCLPFQCASSFSQLGSHAPAPFSSHLLLHRSRSARPWRSSKLGSREVSLLPPLRSSCPSTSSCIGGFR